MGHCSWNLLVLPCMFPVVLNELVRQNSEISCRTFSYITSQVAIPYKTGMRFSRSQYVHPISGAISSTARVHGPMVEMEDYHLLLSLVSHQQNFFSCFCNFMLCWPRSLTSKERKASIRRQNNDSTELEFKTATWPLWAVHFLNKRQKKESLCWLG